jgi:hypothetical protein
VSSLWIRGAAGVDVGESASGESEAGVGGAAAEGPGMTLIDHRYRAYYGALAANGGVFLVTLILIGVNVWRGEWAAASLRTLILLIPVGAVTAMVYGRAIVDRQIAAMDIVIEQRTIERDSAREFLDKFRRGEFVIREIPATDPYDGRKPS